MIYGKSIRNIVFTSLMGLIFLAFGIAYYSTNIYYELNIASQKDAMEHVLRFQTHQQIDLLQEKQKLFAYQLQKESPFRTAIKNKNREKLEFWLDQSYRRYFVTAGYFDLQALYMRDVNKNIIASSVVKKSDSSYLGCPSTLIQLNSEKLSNRLKAKYALCSHNGEFYSEVMVPIGTLKLKGYLHVITHVSDKLTALENELQMPIKIKSASGGSLFQSKNWVNNAEVLILSHNLKGTDGKVGLKIKGSFDLKAFNAKIAAAQQKFFAIILLITSLTIFLVFHFLSKAFKPLDQLRNSATQLLNGKYEPIQVDALPFELESPVQAFNAMISGLKKESEYRNVVESELKEERDFISTTLDSISNAVMVVSVDNIIQFVNPAAIKIFSKSKKKLLNKNMTAAITFYSDSDGENAIKSSEVFFKQPVIDQEKTLFILNNKKQSSELEYSYRTMKRYRKTFAYVLIFKDVTEDRKLKRQLRYDAFHDPLTSLLNRFAFKARFETLIIDESNNNEDHVIAYMDLDRFKVVNDVCGHAAGDLLLNKIAVIFKSAIRKTDIIARLGGDEFGIIFPYCSEAKAKIILNTLVEQIVDYKFVWDEKVFSIGISIGIAQFGTPDDTLDEQMAIVDAACYAAKKAGGNQIHCYTKNAKEVLAHKGTMNWVAKINDAFINNRFVLYAQEIKPINDKITEPHYEVLIRYVSKDGKTVEPTAFLPTAERYNLIERIDIFVVESVLLWLEKHQQALPKRVISINLSGRSISSNSFQKQLETCIKNSNVDVSKLCFEITETAIITDVQNSVKFINAIKALGPKFSLDDFGSGLSSFAYLRQFPVDYLKIDGMFMRDILTKQEDYVIVKSITEVGHSFGMEVIAEYVTSDKMIHLLKKAKVDYAQGFSVGVPKPLSTLEVS